MSHPDNPNSAQKWYPDIDDPQSGGSDVAYHWLAGQEHLAPTGSFPGESRYEPFGILDFGKPADDQYAHLPLSYIINRNDHETDMELAAEADLWETMPDMPAPTWEGQFGGIIVQ